MRAKDFIFNPPDFTAAPFAGAKEVQTAACTKEGVAPLNFYLTSHMPTFYKVGNEWQLPEHNSLNCVAVLKDGQIKIVELRDLKVGDQVVTVTCADLVEQGIFVGRECFGKSVYLNNGNAVESSSTDNYEFLYDLMQHEKENGGYIVWVLGPSVVFDYDTRIALTELAEAGYVNALLAGNAMATHDLEGGYLSTALGQNIYTQESVPMGHYNHLDLLNAVRTVGSTKEFIDMGNVKDGFIKTLVRLNIPYVLAGSVRDDGPLPEVHHKVTDSLKYMKEQTDKATLIIGLATMLHSVSTANLASTYRVTADGTVKPVFMYVVDVTENVANKVSAAREHFATRSMITNVQDFVVNVNRALVRPSQKTKEEALALEFETVAKNEAKAQEKGKLAE